MLKIMQGKPNHCYTWWISFVDETSLSLPALDRGFYKGHESIVEFLLWKGATFDKNNSNEYVLFCSFVINAFEFL